MISSPAGITPLAVMPETAAPASSILSKAARKVFTVSGFLTIRRTTFVTIPSRPSEPTTSPVMSYPGLSSVFPPVSIISPPGRTTSSPRTWFVVTPYLRQWTPPEFSATFPPMVHATWLEGSGA